MPYLIGTDEAGYGPNLGPLVIAGTVWHIQDSGQDLDLYHRLAATITRDPSTVTEHNQFAVADSKALYQTSKGPRLLERALLSCLKLLDKRPESWQSLWDDLAPHSKPARDMLPWYRSFNCDLPLACEAEEITRLANSLHHTCDAAGVHLLDVSSTAVFPGPFNDLVDTYGNKSTLLSQTTLSLVKQLMIDSDWSTSHEPLFIACDKHGGRKRYGALLQQTFPEYLVEILGERSAESIYRWGPENQRVEIRFQARGESFLPTALASMTAKYLRETAMIAFNAFWCERKIGLRPTAGYPTDAKRFRAEIETARQQLNVGERELWRAR